MHIRNQTDETLAHPKDNKSLRNIKQTIKYRCDITANNENREEANTTQREMSFVLPPATPNQRSCDNNSGHVLRRKKKAR